jgi:putative DNA primase/helicase
MSKAKRAKRSPYPRTDAGNGELIAELYAEVLRYDHKQGRWLIWDKRRHRWNEDRTEKIRTFAVEAARCRRRVGARLADEKESKIEIAWAFKSEDRYRIDAALKLASGLPPISDAGEGWDGNLWLLGVSNGVVDLRTGKLREATQGDRITKFSPVLFDCGVDCPRFKQFLNEVFGGDDGLTCYVQKAAGYSMTGLTREQCLFVLHGTGANGKTTLLELLLYVLGDYGVDLPFSALEAKRNGSAPGEAVNLPGARFVKSVEVREGRRLDEARIKVLTGGDTISVRPLYRNSFSFRPTHKLWLAVNHKPVISDNSPAMWRRVRLIPFLQTFQGQRDDKNLLEELKAEAPGILNWLIQGCLAWQRERLEPAASVQQATREYEQESDSLGPFLEDRCILAPDQSVASSELWNAYLAWCKPSEVSPMSRNGFADRLKRRDFTSEESGHGKRRVWRGLSLRPEWAGAGARVGAGADSQNFPNNSPIGEVSGNGHPQAPADPQPHGDH